MVVKTKENLSVLNLMSMEDVEEPAILEILFFLGFVNLLSWKIKVITFLVIDKLHRKMTTLMHKNMICFLSFCFYYSKWTDGQSTERWGRRQQNCTHRGRGMNLP